jgi:integrase
MAKHDKPNSFHRTRWQEPKPKLRKRKGKPSVWETRYRRDLPDGTEEQPREVLGDKTEFPTESALRASPKWKAFTDRINTIRTAVLFRDLCRLYREDEITQRCPHGQISAKGQLWYLEDKWGETRIDQLIQMKYEIKSWLQGDLPLRTDPEKQASRQTRKHLRTLFVQMFSYAADKHYVLYNPFTGSALSVKKGGAPPVDRSKFFISPEQFRFMQADPETPGHVKMMILIAYVAGMREEEFLALKWDDIDFDGPEPQIEINRIVDGNHIREWAKTEKSKDPVPMCDLLGAALLCYRDEYTALNGWLFGSIRTGRPMWPDSLREDHLRPALWRMAAKFKLKEVPKGSGFHSFRHSFNALIAKVGSGSAQVRQVQMELLRHGDERINRRYGKSAPTVREQARRAHTDITELAMGTGVN